MFAHRVPQRRDRDPDLRLLRPTAVVGPLATYAEPHTYDLCSIHAERLTAPRGWEVVRLSGEYVEPEPSHDDLLALANAVREAGKPRLTEHPASRPRCRGRSAGPTRRPPARSRPAGAATCASCATSDCR